MVLSGGYYSEGIIVVMIFFVCLKRKYEIGMNCQYYKGVWFC